VIVGALLTALVTGCPQKLEGALDVKVHVAPTLVADCVKVTLFDGTTDLGGVTLSRAGKNEFQVGVERAAGMPATISIVGTAFIGTNCQDAATLKLNSRGAPVSATFPASAVLAVDLTVDLPDQTLDADHDGYVGSAQGGLDCDDTNASIHPGATQTCDTNLDTNCDGLAGCADPQCTSATTCLNPPDRLTLTGAPATAPRSTCVGPLTLGLANAAGPRVATSAVTVGLAHSASGAIFPSADCSGSASDTVTIPYHQGTVTLSARIDDVGPSTLTATAPGLTAAVVSITIAPLAAASLTLDALPTQQTAGTCSAPVSVTLHDASGQPTSAPTALTVGLQASPSDATGNFFVGADCLGTPVTSVTIAAGQSSAPVRFASTKSGSVAVTATTMQPTPLVAMGTVQVGAAAATRVALTNQPLSLRTSDPCSSARGAQLLLEVQDAFGNRAAAPAAVTLTPSSTLGLVFSDGATGTCAASITTLSIAQGASTASFLLVAPSVGVGTVTVTPNQGLTAVTQAISVAAGDPTHLTIVGPAQAVTAGACSATALTLGLFDASNTPSSFATPLAVTLGTSALPANSNFGFFTAPGCGAGSALVAGALSFPAGQSSVLLYFRSEKVTTFSITATTATVGNASSNGHSITAGPPAAMTWTAPGTPSATAGVCSPSYTLSFFDQFQNATSFAVATSLTPTSTPAGLTFDTGGGCHGTLPLTVPANAQTFTLSAQSTVAGSYTLSATAGAASTTTAAPFTVNPGTPSLATTFPASKPVIVAGTCQQFTVTRADSLGNLVPATPLTLSAFPTGVTAYDTQANCLALTNPGTSFAVTGAVKSVWVRPTLAANSASVTATLGGNVSPLPFDCSAAGASTVAFEQLPLSRVAGVCAGSMTLHLRDAFGNDAVNDPMNTFTLGGGTNVTYFSSTDCSGAPTTAVSFAANQPLSPAFSFKGTTVGANLLTLTGTISGSGTFNVTAAPAAKLVFTTTPPASMPGGGCSGPVSFEVRDQFDNVVTTTLGVNLSTANVSGAVDSASFHSDSACTSSVVTTANVSNASTATFSFVLDKAPAAQNIIATAPSLPAVAGQGIIGQTWNVVTGPPGQVAWKAAPPPSLARFTCSAAVTVQLQDAGGNVITAPIGSGGVPVAITSSSASPEVTFFSDAACTTTVSSTSIPEGASEVTLYASVAGSGSTTLQATSTGLTSSATQSLAVSGAQGSLTLTAATSPLDLEAGGCVALTATRKDQTSTVTTMGTSALSFAVTNAAVTLHAASDCSGPTTTTATIANGSSTAVVYAHGRSAASNTALTITASETNAGLTSSTALAATAYPLVRSGTCTIANNTTTCSTAPTIALPAGNDASRTFLVFQARPNANNARDSFTQCSLTGNTITCSRRNNPNNSIVVQWQTVSFGRTAANGGASVEQQTGTIAAGGAATKVLTLTRAVDVTRSFVLLSYTSALNGGASNVDFLTAKLTATNTVTLASSGASIPGLDYVVQVVEMAGARVDRSAPSAAANAQTVTQAIALSSPVTTRMSPLFSARTAASASTADCRYHFRGVITGTNFVASRAVDGTQTANCLNNAIDEVATELIEWPSGTVVESPATQSLAAGAGSTSWSPTTATVADRTLVYFAGQGPGGQSSGETSSTGSNLGDVRATITAVPNTTTQRATTGGAAAFSPYAVLFAP
jgi:hypothetical protein